MKSFLINNWPVISTLTVAVLSEIMALNPNWKANGLIQLIINVLDKKTE